MTDAPMDDPSDPIPRPPHPEQRREPLPDTQPKEADEDPDAPARVQEILRSPGYRVADRDVEFLNLDETRGVRLQIDYQKAESLLCRRGVERTIVVFGSTRLREPRAAQRRAERLRLELAADPHDDEKARRLAVAERVLANSGHYETARELGRLVGAAGSGPGDSRVIVATGGGPGAMEAANRGAFDVGAESVGLNITLPHEQYPNPYVTPELCLRFHYFAVRKLHFLLRAAALVAFPGGYGTFDELFETLTLIQTRTIRPVPVVLVGEAFWRRAFDVDFLVDEGTIDPEDRELFWFAETAQEVWDGILTWHRANGTPLFSDDDISLDQGPGRG
jgi:uncharacterized protein (TIGR00730 family)